MKLLLIFAILLFVSHAQQVQKSNNLRVRSVVTSKPHPGLTAENSKIATGNPLFSKMREFGLQEVAKRALVSHGVQFAVNPAHQVHSVRSYTGGGLEVTFEIDVRDVYGKDHRASFAVSYQSWRSLMKLERYTLV